MYIALCYIICITSYSVTYIAFYYIVLYRIVTYYIICIILYGILLLLVYYIVLYRILSRLEGQERQEEGEAAEERRGQYDTIYHKVLQ